MSTISNRSQIAPHARKGMTARNLSHINEVPR
jgi:hypothetical protein